MKRLPTDYRHRSGDRRGATLTEVLMSLLIMSIGVISVFSLYPIAVLRSIQSTQLTHSKILLGNAEAELLGNAAMLNGAPPWRANTFYRLGDVISAPSQTGDSALSPLGRFICTQAGTSLFSPPNFREIDPASGNFANNAGAIASDPPGALLEDRNRNGIVNPGEVIWQAAYDDASSLVTVSGVTNYAPAAPLNHSANTGVFVVDPLGWAHHHRTGSTALRDNYGTAPRLSAGLQMLADNDATSNLSRGIAAYGGSASLSVEDTFRPLFGTLGNFSAAPDDDLLNGNQLVRLGEIHTSLDGTYESAFPELPVASVAAGAIASRSLVTLPVSPETLALLTELETTIAALEANDVSQQYRVVLSSLSLNASASRWLVSGYDDDNDNTVDVDAIEPAAGTVEIGLITPPALLAATDLSIRIESFDQRYSFFYTIDANNKTGDCVVLFRRTFDTPVEQGYEASLGDDPEVAGSGSAVDSNRAWIRESEGGIPAEIAVGRQLFDTRNGIWYRINAVLATGQGTSSDLTIVELDRAVEVAVNNDDFDNDTTRAITDPQVVIPRGVVRVFPLNLNR